MKPIVKYLGLGILASIVIWSWISRTTPEPAMPTTSLTCEEVAGMTVNERLFAAGRLEEYDRAVDHGDLDETNEVLVNVCLWMDDKGMHHSLPREDAHEDED